MIDFLHCYLAAFFCSTGLYISQGAVDSFVLKVVNEISGFLSPLFSTKICNTLTTELNMKQTYQIELEITECSKKPADGVGEDHVYKIQIKFQV